jgi:predicted enzyme related to lactoylglutathione lyase
MTMGNAHGDFIWYELLTHDADAAAAFYGAVIGWTSMPSGQPDMDYRFFSSGDGSRTEDGVAGFMAINEEMAAGGARPCWLGYVAVDDVDAACATIEAGGGSIMMPAMDLDGVGRMAMVADPAGAPFYVMRGASDEASHSFAKYAPRDGHAAWNELATADPAGAWRFYGTLFGWVKDGEMDMGPMGAYEFIKSDTGIGAIMPKPEQMPVSAWTTYFRVPDIDAAAAAIGGAGGTMVQEPIEIPGGDYSLVAIDPHGAAFGLVGKRGS